MTATAYDPRTYWRARSERQGASYVGPLGDPAHTTRQAGVFEEYLFNALDMIGRPVGSLLDFGCGVGRFASMLAGQADSYLGVDLNPHAITLAGESNGAHEFRWLAEDSLPVPDASIGVVCAVTVIQHVPESDWLDVWAPEIRRVLKPDGYALIIDDMGGTAAHMFPRSPASIANALGRSQRFMQEMETGHWLGIFA